MKRHVLGVWLLILVICPAIIAAAEEDRQSDLKRAVPAEAYMAVYSRRNPERDFQRQYWQEIYDTAKETRLVPRIVELVTSRASADQLAGAKAVFEELKTAVAGLDLNELVNCQEVVYAQTMTGTSSQHLFLVRLTPQAARDYHASFVKLFRLAQERSDGAVTVATDEDSPADLTTLNLPPGPPFHPAVARLDDVLFVSSSAEMLRQSLQQFNDPTIASKFDDPRLTDALKQLPMAEDGVMFYDGKTQFEQLRAMMTEVAGKAGEESPEAERWLGIMGQIFDEMSVIDYEITVQYTDGRQNRAATLGRVIPGTEQRLLAKVMNGGERFTKWDRWVPENAVGYSLTTGVNLHAVYEFAADFLKKNIPESQEGMQQFEDWQTQIDLHIDRDILQAFSGECVGVNVPADVPSVFSSEQSALAMRCHKPDRVRELLHRLVAQLQDVPMLQSQELKLAACEDLAGFEELSATIFAAFNARPVIGFDQGWMIFGSSPDVVQQVLETRAGDRASILASESFQAFDLKIDGPVRGVKYADLARSTRRIASLLNQAGAIAGMVMGMAGAQVDADDMAPVQEVLALLPSAAKIVAKFDFLEAKLSVTRDGPEPGTYLRESVVLVRPPATETDAVSAGSTN